MHDWPPPHTVRVSNRAKRILLRMHSERGLEIVSPRPLKPARTAQILEQHRHWIERHLPRREAWPIERLPLDLHLHALDQHWRIEHMETAAAARLKVHEELRLLHIHGPAEQAWPLLRRWLGDRAGLGLLPRLWNLAESHRLPLKGASIRWAHSRWGSCSRRGAISLSARLLWLPPESADYVMLHELTHLEHFNHSPAFWHALESRLPGARRIDRHIKAQSLHLPAWLPLLQAK